jgi:hypothetical protein
MIFDNTLSLDNKELHTIEKELKSIGFKKYKTSENGFVFKNNPKYPNLSIEKSFSYNDKLNYGIKIGDDWNTETILSLQLNSEKDVILSVEDYRKNIYSKYFNNEIRKQKVKKLLNPDGD